MPDNRFFTTAIALTAQELADKLSLTVQGDGDILLNGVETLDKAAPNQLSFLDNVKYVSQATQTKAGAVIISQEAAESLPAGVTALVSGMPYVDFARALQLFYSDAVSDALISSKADISPTAQIGKGCSIAPFAVVDDNAVIGDHVVICSGAYIGPNVVIGAGTRVASQASLVCCSIGENCIIHAGARIGQDGFGFAFDGKVVLKVPQVGGVKIGNHVEIGANTTIDRGSLNQTIIGDYCKIDNQVQIAHNVQLGVGCQVVSQSGIAGSTKLGNAVIVGGQAGFAGHIEVADRTTVAARSGVTKSVTEGGKTLSGFPAIPIERWRKLQVAIARLLPKESKK